MSELLKRLTAEAKTTETAPAPLAKDTTGYFSVTRAVERPSFSQRMEPEDTEEVDAEQGEVEETDGDGEPSETGKLQAEIERLKQQQAEILAGNHRAGQIDNETVLDAERWRASQRERKPEPLDPDVEEVLKEMDPKFRKTFEHLANQRANAMLRESPEIKAALEKANRADQTASADTKRKLQAEVAELEKHVPRSSIPQDIQEQVAALRMTPAFANKTVLDIYEIVSGKKVRKATPPPSQKVTSARTSSVRKPPTKDFNEAVRRAMQRQQAEG
ncbi:MAG: hypothetical protein E6Q97_02110 [Desulfurellales bacterium]|nr:MAG: hypothetical protein E6Q97_02110 [Desulfurellales bacterium]